MAKTKKNKRGNSDNVYAKKANNAQSFASGQNGVKKLNPFEVHINKEKFKIIGRTCKHDKGLPGVSRAKAVQRRKQTLGKEYMDKNKSNEFKDHRIGRSFDTMNDDLLNARFVAEKMAQFKKSSRFNLNEDEILTHRGQTLEEIEQFNDDRSDEEFDDDGILNANFTEAVQFGDEESKHNRKTAIEEMIVETKRRKAESAKEKDEIFQLTNKLDSNYKDLIAVVGKLNKPEDIVKPKPDDYDKALREMIFEPRGAVSDRLKSEEEIARSEKERLERLENERLARMREDESTEKKPKHRSADDLDDGYFAGSDAEEPNTLTYDMDGKTLEKNDLNEENDSNELHNDEEEEDSIAEEDETEGEEENDNENESKDEEGSEEDEEEDALSDLKETESESEEEIQPKHLNGISKSSNSEKLQELTKKGSKLPFTIEMPSSYEELKKLICKHNPDDQSIIIDRIIKYNHPKLEHRNKEQMNKLFAYLLQYLNDVFIDASSEDIAASFIFFDRINPFLYDLIQMNPETASVTLLDVIKEKYAHYKKTNKIYPSLETLVFLKIVSNLFTTSDFRHNVVTPCFVFISHILSNARVRTRQDIAMGLFLVTLLLEYTHSSHRFIPSAFNYLLGILYLCVPKRPIETLKIVPPFISNGPLNRLLAVAGEHKDTLVEENALLRGEDLVTYTINEEFKIRALYIALKLTKDLINVVSENVGSNFLAEPFLPMIERIDFDCYPNFVRSAFEETKSSILNVTGKSLVKLTPPEKKPKALRLFEPRIEKVYDDKRRPKLSKAKEEKVKLIHKIKRETKGAVREIRRDTEFLQKIRINQQIQSDRARKEKVKRIYMEASVQQGELNELSRKKKKM